MNGYLKAASDWFIDKSLLKCLVVNDNVNMWILLTMWIMLTPGAVLASSRCFPSRLKCLFSLNISIPYLDL